MTIIHTPRVIYSIGKGLWKKYYNNKPSLITSSSSIDGTKSTTNITNNNSIIGIGVENGHIYHGNVGIFDIDYLGHMNNAAYLSHCEYARWEMCSINNMVSAMYQYSTYFVVGSSVIRYRKELKPLFKSFIIESYVAGLNNKSLYIIQNIRYKPNERVLAQIIIEGLTIHKKNGIINPTNFLIDDCNVPKDIIESIRISDTSNNTNNTDTTIALLNQFQQMDITSKDFASYDDERIKNMMKK